MQGHILAAEVKLSELEAEVSRARSVVDRRQEHLDQAEPSQEFSARTSLAEATRNLEQLDRQVLPPVTPDPVPAPPAPLAATSAQPQPQSITGLDGKTRNLEQLEQARGSVAQSLATYREQLAQHEAELDGAA